MSRFNYYVYAYLRSTDSAIAKAGTPYYIGKGIGKRAYSTQRQTARPVDLANIVIVERNLSNVGALAIERRLIRWYGRVDTGTGILRNLTDGGEGSPGSKLSCETKQKMSKPKSDSHRKNISKGKKGILFTAEHIENLRLAHIGKPSYIRSNKTKEKNKIARQGMTLSPEWRKNISNGHKGQIAWNKGKKMSDKWKSARPWHQCNNCGKQSQNLTAIKRFHNEKCTSPSLT